MQRVLEPEWLDELPPGDARAARSRSDLRRVNAFMGNSRLLSSTLSRFLEDGATIADLGSGDGRLMLSVARRLPWKGEIILVDRAPVVTAATLTAFRSMGWKTQVAASDALTFLEEQTVDIVVANLFLHHLDDASLAALFGLASRKTRLLLACEPARSAFALGGCRLLRLIGCNDVTRHDARVSVRAGFRGSELSRLWPAEKWTLEERKAGLFSHLFVASRDAR